MPPDMPQAAGWGRHDDRRAGAPLSGGMDDDYLGPGVTREMLLDRLSELGEIWKDAPRQRHERADLLLLVYINDEKVTAAYAALRPRWRLQ